MKVSVALLAAALFMTAGLAGCSSKKADSHSTSPTTSAAANHAVAPVLYLNITIGNHTFPFTTATTASAAMTMSASHSGSSHASNSTSTSGSHTTSSSSNTTGPTGNASAAAGNSMPSGVAPLNVTFQLGASGLAAHASANWTFDFGRSGNATTSNATAKVGNATSPPAAANGTKLPATLNGTYSKAGDYNVTFVLRAGAASAYSLKATLHVGTGTAANATATKALPAVTHFEFGQSLGCTGDVGGNTCVDFQSGPPGQDIDGHWIPLDESYWGLLLTSTVDQGNPALNDSDCTFTDADGAATVDASNGGDPCMGVVPDGTAYVFLYPYGGPALGMTVDFGIAPPA